MGPSAGRLAACGRVVRRAGPSRAQQAAGGDTAAGGPADRTTCRPAGTAPGRHAGDGVARAWLRRVLCRRAAAAGPGERLAASAQADPRWQPRNGHPQPAWRRPGSASASSRPWHRRNRNSRRTGQSVSRHAPSPDANDILPTQARPAGNGLAVTGTRGRRCRLKAMTDVAIRAAARPGQRRLVYRCAVLAASRPGPVIRVAARASGFQDGANYVA